MRINILAVNPMTIVTAVVVCLIIAALLGLLLAIASKFLKVEQDERIDQVASMLPGYNCGACGKAGCAAFAEALVTGEAPAVSGCKVIKPDNKQAIKDYLDVTPGPDGSIVNVKL
jgi:electron transport complex protein RnfB